MKITYDKKVDALYIRLNEAAAYHNSKKITDDVLIDYAQNGQIVGLEILDASKHAIVPELKQKITLQPA